MAGTLYIVATPIGNLGDCSQRMTSTLERVDVVFAEDTRVTRKLLSHLNLDVRLERYDHHSHDRQIKCVVEALSSAKDVAYVSDAGTPGVEDPGGRLVEAVAEQFPDVDVIPIPGPSSIMSALSVSGFPADRFSVWGFPPKKKGRKTYFDGLAQQEGTVALYESTHRIVKTVEEIASRQPQRTMFIAREMTKRFETYLRGTAAELAERLPDVSTKGEFVIVLK